MSINQFRRLLSPWIKGRPNRPLRRPRLLLETLEDRLTPAAPTLSVFNNHIVVPGGQTYQVPLTGFDEDGDVLTYTIVGVDTPQVSAQVATVTHSLVLSVTGKDGNGQTFTGDLVLALFEDLAPLATGRIITLTNSGFYNGVTFHRVIQDFMGQSGDPTGTGGGGSMLGNFADEFDAILRFNGFGQFAMANSGPNTNDSQFFITDVDLSVGSPSLSKLPPQHLNDVHTIFGQLTDGFSTLASLISTPKQPASPPNQPSFPIEKPIITSATIITNSQDAVIRVTADPSFLGVATVTVKADDGNGNIVMQTFQVSVANERPELGTIPDLATTVDRQLRYMLPRSDREHDWTFFFVGAPNPAGPMVTVDQSTGLLTVDPQGFVGTFQVAVGVGDSTPRLNPLDVEILTITVAANLEPTATAPGAVTAARGADTLITLTGEDGDMDVDQQLTFEIVTLPVGGKLRDATGKLLAVGSKITASDLGTAKVYFTANPGSGDSASFLFKVRDSGGTVGGGVDTSDNATVTINIVAAATVDNVRYSFTKTAAGKRLNVLGTDLDDVIDIRQTFDKRLMVTLDPTTAPLVLPLTAVKGGVQVQGLLGDDTLTATANLSLKTTLDGGAGNDVLTGGAAADRLLGGDGNDQLAGRGGNDRLFGGNDNDLLLGGAGIDHLFGEAGDDTLDGGVGNDKLNGADGNDSLFSGPGKDTVTGGAGNDIFGPKAGPDKRDFQAGTDRLSSTFDSADLLGMAVFDYAGAPDILNFTQGFKEQNGSINYAALGFTSPPTYGPHHPAKAGVSPVPTGFHTSFKSDEDLVHNLERGHVWISYRPDLLNDDELQSLKDLVALFGPQSGIVVTPRDFGQDALTLTTWGRMLPMNTFNLAQILQFILANRGAGRPAEGYLTP